MGKTRSCEEERVLEEKIGREKKYSKEERVLQEMVGRKINCKEVPIVCL